MLVLLHRAVSQFVDEDVEDLVGGSVEADANLIPLVGVPPHVTPVVPQDGNKHTLLGRVFQLVWRPGRQVWDDAGLRQVAEKYGVPWDELQACGKVQKAGTWAIRKRGK